MDNIHRMFGLVVDRLSERERFVLECVSPSRMEKLHAVYIEHKQASERAYKVNVYEGADEPAAWAQHLTRQERGLLSALLLFT
jgi:hypothetical protein